ncbi:response regulator [Longimicrobium sp.]|uniref:response regulator n=1 Tax=Longimicrobium sp. TaxID=2029185 RepID=UPI002E3716FA|nr:response regulator [Longimicrobium sp.]HEX6039093.1 response regulator [Longimicrobium sp.]
MTASPLVLVADHDPDARHILTSMLRHLGASVMEAQDGEQALRLARAHPFTAMVSEYLWCADGRPLHRCLRGSPDLAGVPLYVVTSDPSEGRRAAALRTGCAAVILKPIPPSVLAALVLGRGGRAGDPGAGGRRFPTPGAASPQGDEIGSGKAVVS